MILQEILLQVGDRRLQFAAPRLQAGDLLAGLCLFATLDPELLLQRLDGLLGIRPGFLGREQRRLACRLLQVEGGQALA